MSKNSKPKKASSSNKKKNEKIEKKSVHVCGAINGVMGKGAFSKEGDKFRCVECGKVQDKLPEGYLPALKKLSPKRAALLEKGEKHQTTGAEHEKWKKAGEKAWVTRRKNEASKAQNKKQKK
jgi:hypothetical protein